VDFIVTGLATLIGLGFALAAFATSPLLSVPAVGGLLWFIGRQVSDWR